MFGINIDLLWDFHTSVMSQTAPEDSVIFKVTNCMLGISTLGFATLMLNNMTKMPPIQKVPIHFYWQLLTIIKLKIAPLKMH